MNTRGISTLPKNFTKNLKIPLVRTPFEDFTNMSLKSNKISTKVNKNIKDVASATKVPIYKRQMDNVVEKKKSDLYEFDESDSEPKKIRKPRRALNNSAKCNRTMYDILQRLEKLEKRKAKKLRQKKKDVQISPNKYEMKVNNALKRVMEKVKKKNITKNKENVNVVSPIKKELRVILERSTLSNINVPNVKPGILRECAINSTNKPIVPQPEIVSNTINLSPRINIMSNILINRDNLPLSQDAIINEDDLDNNCHNYSDYDSDEDRYFGFDSDNDDDNIRQKKPIKLDLTKSTNISQLSINSPMFTPRRPNAHSTMLHNMQNSPWRLSAAVRRNPHFLLIKNNSLPSLKQDMILNHSQVDRLEKNFSKTPSVVEVAKPAFQSSILDYVNYSGHIENTQNNIINSSLFDNDEFVTKPRHRRVLGVIQNNNQIISTPVRNIEIHVPAPDVSYINRNDDNDGPFFGFDNSNNENFDNSYEENKENSNRLGAPIDDPFFGFDNSNDEDKENSFRPSIAKPLRLNVEIGKFYRRQLGKKTSPITMNIDSKDMDEMVSDIENIGDENQDINGKMHLFEDTEPEINMSIAIPNIKYERKRRRRLKSDASNDSDDDKPKKRKKDVMSKAEEAEMEKWASEFNAMCREVDKYELEIE